MIFGPGSAEDFPVMIEERFCRLGLLIGEHDISFSIGLEHVSPHCPVTDSGRFYCIASSGTPDRLGTIAGKAARRNSRMLEFFVRRDCILHEREKLESITRLNVWRRTFV
jgi:hypothetical protein